MLTEHEKERKKERLDKFSHKLELDPFEIREPKAIIDKDDGIDSGTKMLLMRGLGFTSGYPVSHAIQAKKGSVQ